MVFKGSISLGFHRESKMKLLLMSLLVISGCGGGKVSSPEGIKLYKERAEACKAECLKVGGEFSHVTWFNECRCKEIDAWGEHSK